MRVTLPYIINTQGLVQPLGLKECGPFPRPPQEKEVQSEHMWCLLTQVQGCPHLTLLLNQTWVCSPTLSKSNLLTPGCDEGKCSICCWVQTTASAQQAQTP